MRRALRPRARVHQHHTAQHSAKGRRLDLVDRGTRGRSERVNVDRTQRSTEIDPFIIKVRRMPHTRARRKRSAPFESSSYTAQKMPVQERVPTNTRGRGGSRVARDRKECPGSVRITAGFERGRCAHLRRCYLKWPIASHRAVDVQHRNVEKERASSPNEVSLSAM